MTANLSITKMATLPDDNDPTQIGDTITYTITIINTGDMDATNAILTDVIDANTTLTAGTLDITPIARNDGFDGNEDTMLTVNAASGVLGNDTDLDGGALVGVTAVAGDPANVGVTTASTAGGSVTMLADGSFSYTPPAGFSGTDTFEYTVTDDEGDTDTAIVSIDVAPGNTSPDAMDDTFNTGEGVVLNGDLFADNGSGVDLDADMDTFSVTSNTSPTNGMVVVNPDGTFTYTPNPSFNGSDSFTYTIDDGNGGMDTATVFITVGSAQQICNIVFNPPVDGSIFIGDNNDSVVDGTNLNDVFSGMGGNDTLSGLDGMDLIEGDSGVDTLSGNDGNDFLDGGADSDFLFGGADNDFLFGGTGDDLLDSGMGDDYIDGGLGNDIITLAVGGTDTIVFRLGDGFDTVFGYEDGIDKIQLKGILTFDDLSFTLDGADTIMTDTLTGEDLARFVGVGVGAFDRSDFFLEVPVFTSISTAMVPENATGVVLDVTAIDDCDVEGLGLTYSFSTVSGGGIDNGAFNLDANTGELSFIAPPDFEMPGDADLNNEYILQVTATDSDFLRTVQNITITVNNTVENTAPVIISDGGGATAAVSIDENTTLVTDVQTLDDLDAEGAGLLYSITGGDDQAFFTLDATTGELSFIAPPDFENPLDGGTNPTDNDYEVQVTVTDSGLLTDTQDITVTVNDVPDNSDPTAQNQTYSTFGNTVLEVAGADIPGNEVASVTSTISLLTGATDPDVGDTLSVQAGTFATTAGGSVTIFSDGSFFYTPQAGDVSVADTFTFTVLDGNGGSDTATATINVSDNRIWYVDDDAAAGGDGTSGNPFDSLAPLNTGGSSDGLDGIGDTIYVLAGTYTGSITLETNQSLIGQAVDLVVDGTTLITGSNTNRPSLSSPGNNAITLASGNTVRGLEITGNTTQDGIIGSNVGNLLVDNNVFDGIDLEAIQVDNTIANATITIQNNIIDGTNSTGNTEIEVLNTGGSATNVTINVTGNDLNNTNSAGVLVQNNGSGSANVTVSSNQIERTFLTATGIAVELNGNGTITTLINENTVTGAAEASDAFLITSDNGTGTVNATVTNNTNTAAPTLVGSGFAAQSTDNNILNLTIFNNDFLGRNGGVIFGALTDDIALEQFGGSTFNVTQTSAANVSAINNGDTVGTRGTINFGQPAPPQPLLAASVPTISNASDSLTEADLVFIADAAIDRWSETGLSATQIETLESITFEVVDLPDWYIGAATGTQIQIDTDAFGWGWFVDSTPLEDSEFSTLVSTTAFQADAESPAAGQIDLLTVVMHEMGHVLGLPDLRDTATLDQLMNGTIPAGTRRLPTVGLVNGVVPDDGPETEYIDTPIDLSTLNPGQVVTIEFEVTLDEALAATTTSVTNVATVVADGGISEIAQASTSVNPAPLVKGQPATAYVDVTNTVIGNAFQAGAPYTGNLFSNTDITANPTDVIAGTGGNDNIWAGETGDDCIGSGAGNDTIGIGGGDVWVDAGADDDFVYAIVGGGTNTIDLGTGNDEFWTDGGNNEITSASGNNTIGLGTGNDTVNTGDGDDVVYTVNAGGGNNTLNLGDGTNTVYVEEGNYDITTGTGDDSIGLGTGTDIVDAGDGNNIIYRVDPSGTTDGTKDILTGIGNDYVQTGSGNDRLNLGTHAGGPNDFDIALGQGGNDVFVLNEGSGFLSVGDFTQGEDQLEISDLTFGDLDIIPLTGSDRTLIRTSGGDVLAELQGFTSPLTSGDFLEVVSVP